MVNEQDIEERRKRSAAQSGEALVDAASQAAKGMTVESLLPAPPPYPSEPTAAAPILPPLPPYPTPHHRHLAEAATTRANPATPPRPQPKPTATKPIHWGSVIKGIVKVTVVVVAAIAIAGFAAGVISAVFGPGALGAAATGVVNTLAPVGSALAGLAGTAAGHAIGFTSGALSFLGSTIITALGSTISAGSALLTAHGATATGTVAVAGLGITAATIAKHALATAPVLEHSVHTASAAHSSGLADGSALSQLSATKKSILSTPVEVTSPPRAGALVDMPDIPEELLTNQQATNRIAPKIAQHASHTALSRSVRSSQAWAERVAPSRPPKATPQVVRTKLATPPKARSSEFSDQLQIDRSQPAMATDGHDR